MTYRRVNCDKNLVYIIDTFEQIDLFVNEILEGCTKQDASYKMLQKILNEICEHLDILTILVQNEYVDRVYRDCYYHHISGKHSEVDRYCQRLFLFDGDCAKSIQIGRIADIESNLIGTIVIKPIREGAIGRSLLKPQYLLSESGLQCRTSHFKASLYGQKFRIDAFPFSMQDQETLTCAEITILNLLDYYSNHFTDYHFVLPSDITEVTNRNGFERALPAHGMSYMMISKALTEFGFFPRLYIQDSLKFNSYKMKCLLHYYIESGIPVGVGIRSKGGSLHSILAIGCEHYSSERLKAMDFVAMNEYHSERFGDDINAKRRFYLCDIADSCHRYVVMDDNAKPYSIYEYAQASSNSEYLLNDATVCSIVVPLYKRMYLEAMDAKSIAHKYLSIKAPLLDAIYSEKNKSGTSEIGIRDNPLILRLFLASSNTYLEERLKVINPSSTEHDIYIKTPLPRFVWIIELFDPESLRSGKTIGEIVLDATASRVDGTDAIILFRFFDHIGYRNRKGQSDHSDWLKNSMISSNPQPNDIILYKLKQSEEIPMFSGNLK